jgi:hypothetical protein
MEETKTCKTCNIDKPITEYYESKNVKSGRLNICKRCTKLKRRISDVKEPELRDTYDKNWFRLYGVNQDQYNSMYEFLRGLGYDCKNGDIHQQFLDKWNPKITKEMKPKKRPANSDNLYLCNGDVNPNYNR